MVYVGAEVTIGGTRCFLEALHALIVSQGWIVTFIQTVRGGGASSGYISSGFFGGKQISVFFESRTDESIGLMLGRLVLLWVNQKVSSIGLQTCHFEHPGASHSWAIELPCSCILLSP